MGFYRFSVLLLAVAVAGLLVGQPSAQATFVAVGVYDEQTTQTNAVDFDAPYDAANSTGVGANAGLVFGVNPFKPAVLAAFNSGNGGVVQFNNTSDIVAGSGTNSFTVDFAGNTKVLTVTNVDHLRTDFSTTSRTAISGPSNTGFLAKSNANGDVLSIGGNFNFTLTETSGFAAGEHVRAIAGTILGRNGSSPLGNWLMRATLDNGDVIAAFRAINSNSGNTTDDTFYGAVAPPGRYITGVSWTQNEGVFSALDDFAFITSDRDILIPEPSALVLLALGCLALVYRRK